MRKTLFLTVVMALGLTGIQAQENAGVPDLKSPDGRLVVSLNLTGAENPTYSVTYDGKQMLEDSPIGIMLDMGSKPTLEGLPQGREAGNGDFTKNLKLVSALTDQLSVDYTMDRIKTAHVSHEYTLGVYELQNAANQNIEFEFRVSNNDIAIRYNIPKPRQRASTRVLFENTGFRFPDGTTTFLTPQSDAMIGWQRSKPSYEEGYSNDGQMNVRSQYGHGYTFPGLFHVGENGWVLLCETGVSSSYCGSRLGDCKDNTYKIEFPMPDENNGNGTVCPAMRLPGSTPWRTITVGSDLKPIVETTVMWDYVEPLFAPSREYVYGRSTWSWIVWQDASCNWDDQVKFIDLASAMGW
ncbi:MAG: glycoside hydrolase family 97 N-terminal domain-containing protein, partial [Bacteroidaceae bacterium]|nr:glycoside hydrolase family 97 N-terminal domain-containing protein [Bacteroidaceae bacterium]